MFSRDSSTRESRARTGRGPTAGRPSARHGPAARPSGPSRRCSPGRWRRRRSARGRRRSLGWRRSSAAPRPGRPRSAPPSEVVEAELLGRRAEPRRRDAEEADAGAEVDVVEQRAQRRARWRRRCRRRRRSVVARVIVREPAVAHLERERARARRRPLGAGRRRRRRGGTSSRCTSATSWRSWANVSSWPIDLTSRSGSTARSSRPLARSTRCWPWARPRAPITAAGSRAARSPTVATPIRSRRASVAGPTPHSRRTGRAWR